MSHSLVPVGSIFSVISGATPASSNRSYWDGDIPWVTPADLGALEGNTISAGSRNITFDGYANCGTQIVPEGSIVLSIRAPIGHMAITSQPLCFNQGCRGLVPSSKIRTDFGYWALSAARPELEAAGQGTTFIELARSKLRIVKIPLPDLETQKAIATFLDRETARIDQLIEKKEQQVAVLSEREEATFLEIVTGRDLNTEKRLSGVEWIGDIPAHWIAPKFTHVAQQETGHTPSRKEDSYWRAEECVIPWFSLADVWQIRDGGLIYVTETAEKISQFGMDNSAARLLPAQTVILSRTASVGFPAILSLPMATTQDFVGWICGERIRPKFLYYVLRSMKPEFRRLMMGSTHQTIYMPDIRSFRLPLPPLAEQDEIVARLDRRIGAFRAAAVKVKESIAKLKEHRSALITAAVSGQIDVRGYLPATAVRPDRREFRSLIGAEIVAAHRNNPRFGRVKLQKELYLAEAHLGISELEGNYLREAAGPLDRALIEDTEQAMAAAGFYRADQPEGRGTPVIYTALVKAGEHKAELDALLGERADALRNMIEKLRDLDRSAVEAVATLYAVWNDALMDGDAPNDDAIIEGVLADWHAEKSDKFRGSDLARWLGWMRRHDLVPRGEGPKTSPTMIKDMFS